MDAVIFDLFGTLVPNLSNEYWRGVTVKLALILEVDATVFERAWVASFNQRMTGEVREMEEQFRFVLREMGAQAAPEQLAQAAELKKSSLCEALAPRPETLEVL